MEIATTKQEMREMIAHSERLKKGFSAMVLMAPQVLDEEDLHALRRDADVLAANFDTCASWLYNFSRMSGSSTKFLPSARIDGEKVWRN